MRDYGGERMLERTRAIILVTFLLVGGMSQPMNAVTFDRATWLWDPQEFVHDEAGILSFLAEKKINKLYVQIDRTIPVRTYRSFIAKATARGIKIYALDGAPDWADTKGNLHQDKLMRWLAAYQKGSKMGEKFRGVHLDVEPYLLKSWEMERETIVTNYQSLILRAKTQTSRLKLSLEMDIPFWFDEIPYDNRYGKGVLSEWVITRTSRVTILAYRDQATSVIDLVASEISFAEKHRKTVVIGVETGKTSEGDLVSFYEEGEAYMNSELEKVQNHYGKIGGFGGIAVHHVASWKSMRP